MIRIMSLVSMPSPRSTPPPSRWRVMCMSSGISANSLTRQNYLSSPCERVHLERSEWDTAVRWRGCYLDSEARGHNGWRVSRQDEGRLFEVLKRCFVVMFFLKYLFLILKRILCGLNGWFLSSSWKDNKPFRNMCVCLGKVGKVFIVYFTWLSLIANHVLHGLRVLVNSYCSYHCYAE